MSEIILEFPQQPPIPSYLLRDVLAKLAYIDERVKSASIADGGESISLTISSSASAELQLALADRVQQLVTAMVVGGFEPDIKILESRRGGGAHFSDPMVELLERREVFEEGKGFFAIGPLLSKLIDYVDREILKVGAAMGARPYRFPALISPDYMQDVQYFKNFPHSLSFCTHLRENFPDIEQFSREAKSVNGRIVSDSNLYASPPAMLSPTVCHHLYQMLRGVRIEGSGLTATAHGHCFRYESSNMRSLERVWNFTMREIIFVGTEDYVRDRLTTVRSLLRPLMEILDLSYSVTTANDPFFIATYRDQAAYQAAFDLKHEIRVSLPYNNDTLAVGSYNRHGDFFGRTLSITNEDGSPVETGCFGLGFERLALAFVAQHGVEPDKWPRVVQAAIPAT